MLSFCYLRVKYSLLISKPVRNDQRCCKWFKAQYSQGSRRRLCGSRLSTPGCALVIVQDKGTASQDLLPTASWSQLRDFQRTGTAAVISLSLGGGVSNFSLVASRCGGSLMHNIHRLPYKLFALILAFQLRRPSETITMTLSTTLPRVATRLSPSPLRSLTTQRLPF